MFLLDFLEIFRANGVKNFHVNSLQKT